MKTAIVWFRKDLRLHDNEALYKASQLAEEIIPFYCFDETEYGKTTFGFDKSGSFRTQFNIESVTDLRNSLEAIGNNLCIRKGNTAEELLQLIRSTKAEAVFTSKEIHSEEIDIQQQVELKIPIPIDYSFGSCLYHVNDLPHPYQDTPEVFTTFRKGLEKKSKVRALKPKPQKLAKPQIELDWGNIPNTEELGVSFQRIDPKAADIGKRGRARSSEKARVLLF